MRAALLFLFLCASCHSVPTRMSDPNRLCFPVIRVVDGDTFWVDDGSEKGLKIRLIGIDAPESRHTFNKEKHPFGEVSTRFMEQLITGKCIKLEFDVGRKDRYGRTLAYAWLENGVFINALMIKEGYATVMTVPPNVKYAEEFVRLQRKARKRKKGIWGQ